MNRYCIVKDDIHVARELAVGESGSCAGCSFGPADYCPTLFSDCLPCANPEYIFPEFIKFTKL